MSTVDYHKAMWTGGVGLPIAAIGWSIVISFSGCWAWLETAHFWAFLNDWINTGVAHAHLLSPGYVAFFIAAAFALLAQWTANFVVLRIRRGRNNLLWASYAICALYAAVSLHHVHEAMVAPQWAAAVHERQAARATDLQIVRDNETFINQVRGRVAGLSTETTARRTEAVASPMVALMAQADHSSTGARTRLAAMPELPEQRPYNAVDAAVGLLAAALALLEFCLYWGIGSTMVGAASCKPATGEASGSSDATSETHTTDASETPATSRSVRIERIIYEPITVGGGVFETNKGGRFLIDQLEKAGLLNETDVRSKLGAINNRRRGTKLALVPQEGQGQVAA